MNGLIFSYKCENPKYLSRLNYELFGRINHQKCKGRKYIYYIKGLLHDTKYKRLVNGMYFVLGKELKIDITKKLEKYSSTYKIEESNTITAGIINENAELTTGFEYWSNVASFKEYRLRRRK